MEATDSQASTATSERLAELVAHVERVFLGKRSVVELAVTCLLAEGHLLLEDLPGVGKTTLARALARSIGGLFQRIQFTSDLLPADILGVSVLGPGGRFEFRPGPLFANVVLADEINRSTPRTQSALLEAMAEGRVSLDSVTRDLPRPFLVLATQNPQEVHGTYPLPESQLDRFLMCLAVGYPADAVERALLLTRGRSEPVEALPALLSLDELQTLQARVDRVRVDESLIDQLLALVQATRRAPALRSGLSTRAALSFVRAARAHALVRGRDYCLPDDLQTLFLPVLAHRVRLRDSGASRREAQAVLSELAAGTPLPL